MSVKQVTEGLSGVLADTYVLFAKTQNYHWNVVGPQFHALHVMFEEQYNELFLAIDEVAERIRQLGSKTPGTLADFLKLSVVSEVSATSAANMVADLASCNQKVAERAGTCLKYAVEAGDDGTQDLMIRRMAAHEKASWMLRATLGDEPREASSPVAAPARPSKIAKTKKPKGAKSAKSTAMPVAVASTPTKGASTKPPKSAKKKGRVAMG